MPGHPRFTVVAQTDHHVPHMVHPCDTCAARQFSACGPLDAGEQNRLAEIMNTIKINPNETIFDESEPARFVFTVREGAVKVYKLLADGRRQVTGFLGPGDFLGLTHNEAYAYSAEAVTPTVLCRFPRQKLESLLAEIPRLEQRLLGIASHELAAAQDQMMLLGRKSARERVVSFLLMLSDAAVRRNQQDNPVLLPMTRTDIADYLGLTIETVSRTLSRLKAKGLIQLRDERQIALTNLEALRDIAAGN